VSYGDLGVRDAQRLIPHQPSREHEVRSVRDLVQRRLITVLEGSDVQVADALVDEYRDDYDEGTRHSLADLGKMLRESQRLTTAELESLNNVCHHPRRQGRDVPHNARIVFATSTLRTLARFDWLERLLTGGHWCVRRSDFEREVNDLQAYEAQRAVYDDNRRMWEELTDPRKKGNVEFKACASSNDNTDDESDTADSDESKAPPFLDALLLANDLGCRLFADDRVCQSAVLNEHPDN